MNSKHQEQFEKQLVENRQKSINEFLSREDLYTIKVAYAEKFERIKTLIAIYGARLSIESIENTIGEQISSDFDIFLLMQEINNAILDGYLTQDMLS